MKIKTETNSRRNEAGEEEKQADEYAEYKRRFLDYLEKQKIVEYGTDNEIICDLEKIKALSYNILSQSHFDKRFNIRNFDWQKMMFEIFSGREVLSVDDFEKKKKGEGVEAKPLFYCPPLKEAFDVQKVAEAEFYLAPSEIKGRWDKINLFYEENFGYTAEEADLALTIYHKTMGAGKRDNASRLRVKKDFDKDLFQSVSHGWLMKNLKKHRANARVQSGTVDIWNRPKEGIKNRNYKNLRESGLLTENDFRLLETGNTALAERKKSKIQKKGTITVNSYNVGEKEKKSLNIRYILGVEFEGKELVKLEDNLYGIVAETQGQKEITHIFRPNDYETVKRRYEDFEKRTGKQPHPSNIVVGKRDLDFPGVKKFDETEFMQSKREGENDQDYANRIATFNAIRNYNKLERLTSALVDQAGIGLHNLSLREQNCLTTYAFSGGDQNFNRLVGFCKKFGREGMKIFLACELETGIGEKILELGQLQDEQLAKKIFRKFNEILEQAEHSVDEIAKATRQDKPSEELLEKIKNGLLKTGKDIISQAHDLSDRGKTPRLLSLLENAKAGIMLFAEAFKQTNIDLEQIEGVELAQISGDELLKSENKELKQQMMALIKNNYPDKFGKKVVIPALEKAIGDPSNRFYVLKNNDDLIGFMRFEDLPNRGIYFGSFNVDNNAKQCGLGHALMSKYIESEGDGRIIMANVETDKAIAGYYINKMGFVATKILPDVEGTGTNGFEIQRDDLHNHFFKRQTNVVELSKEEFILEAKEKLNSGKYVLTYYNYDPKTKIYYCDFAEVPLEVRLAA